MGSGGGILVRRANETGRYESILIPCATFALHALKKEIFVLLCIYVANVRMGEGGKVMGLLVVTFGEQY